MHFVLFFSLCCSSTPKFSWEKKKKKPERFIANCVVLVCKHEDRTNQEQLNDYSKKKKKIKVWLSNNRNKGRIQTGILKWKEKKIDTFHSFHFIHQVFIKNSNITTIPDGTVQTGSIGEASEDYYLILQRGQQLTGHNSPPSLLSLSMNLRKVLCFPRKYSELWGPGQKFHLAPLSDRENGQRKNASQETEQTLHLFPLKHYSVLQMVRSTNSALHETKKKKNEKRRWRRETANDRLSATNVNRCFDILCLMLVITKSNYSIHYLHPFFCQDSVSSLFSHHNKPEKMPLAHSDSGD